MKTLYIVRHAKSSWKLAGQLRDFERPLNPRGLRDAPFMAGVISGKGIRPDLLLSSPATRAQATAQAFAKAFRYPASAIQLELGIYEAWGEQVLDILRMQPGQHQSIMIFGHNPAFTSLVQEFAAEAKIDNMPTCGICCINFEVDHWYEIDSLNARFQWFEYPKLYFPKAED